MSEWIEMYERPYAEDDALLNDFVNDALRRASWHLFEKQEEIVYMANETESGIPKMKEGAIDIVRAELNHELAWLREYMVNRILISYLKGNIESSEEVDYHFRDDFDEEDYADFRKEIDEYIWNDYAQFLGEERTAELWKKWGK